MIEYFYFWKYNDIGGCGVIALSVLTSPLKLRSIIERYIPKSIKDKDISISFEILTN